MLAYENPCAAQKPLMRETGELVHPELAVVTLEVLLHDETQVGQKIVVTDGFVQGCRLLSEVKLPRLPEGGVVGCESKE